MDGLHRRPMQTMRRLPVAIFLILALVLAPVAPLSAGWSCPDGTACVAEDQGYRCAKDGCDVQMDAAGCCAEAAGPRCHHGDFPGVAAPASAALSIGAADHCRFTVTTSSDVAAFRVAAATYQLLAPDGLPPQAGLQFPLPTVTRFLRVADTTGYRPPLLTSTGPSRAPPAA